jgi:L-asparagine transporter-like permease
MKTVNFIPLVILIGVVVLFFFPEPQTNFLAYVSTALFFVLLVVFLIIKSQKDKVRK